MGAARPGLFTQIIQVLFACLVLGTAAQFLSPTRIPWHEDWSNRAKAKAENAGIAIVDTEQARAIVDAGIALIFDARSQGDYDADHLPGALPFPDAKRAEFYPQYADVLTPDQQAMIYCTGETCDESLELCMFLLEQGHTNILLYLGGFTDWQEAGYPVAR
ncbi:MAG: rhodanese-like domain-containing protein [Kiritimatiellae bacterium]|nr:rhodanese-like domain-containing protein [Kiritimatiellia bacterium]